jgi:regulator of replication initiation timing
MINRQYWLSLPKEIRQRLVVSLDIPRTGSTEVFGQTIITDGYTDKDLSTVTLDKLQEFMMDKSDNFDKLLETLIQRLQTPIVIPEKKEEILTPIVDFLKENEELKIENAILKKENEELKNPNKYLYNGATTKEVIAATTPKIIVKKPGRPAKK